MISSTRQTEQVDNASRSAPLIAFTELAVSS